jgi:glucans biosynthesis protein
MGSIYDRPVRIHAVEDGRARELPFREADFRSPEAPQGPRPWGAGGGFAGFTVHYPVNQAGRMDDAAVFLGASLFRAAARHSRFGGAARALILDPAAPGGEEYPFFREFWLVRPRPGESALTVFALLDSASLTGAVRLVLRPGSSMSMEISARLFLRKGKKWPAKVGLAPSSGMYLYSEKENGSPRDWRPEVHGTDGLLYSDTAGNWHLRALNNPGRLMTTGFPGESARGGWGLIQRDNDFDHYQDLDRRPDLSTWVWIQPGEGFPEGSLDLIEIPSDNEIHDNVIAYWSVAPEELAGASLSCAYTLYWMPPASNPHNLGRVVAVRLARPPSGETAEFHLDFDNSLLNSITEVEGLASVVESDAAMPALERSLHKNPVTGGWRLKLILRAPSRPGVLDRLTGYRGLAAGRGRVFVRLVRGENLPLPITETFVYDFPPVD